MKCPSCGNDVEFGLKNCPSCNSHLQIFAGDNINSNNSNVPRSFVIPPDETKKKNKANILVAIVAALVVISSLGVLTYRNLDYILSAKSYYLYLEARNYALSSSSLGSAYENFIFKAEDYYKNYHSSKKLHYSLKINTKGSIVSTFYPDIAMIEEFVNGLDVTMKLDNDLGKKKIMADSTVSFKGTNLLKGSFYQMDNLYAINIPMLYNKIVAVDTNNQENLKTLMNSKEDVIPKKTIDPVLFLKAIDLDKNKVTQISKSLEDIFIKDVPGESITIERNVEFDDGDGGKLSAKKVKTLLSNSDFKKLCKDILNQLASDETLLSSMENTMNNLKTRFKDAGYPIDEQLNPKDARDNFKKGITEMITSIDTDKTNITFAMTLFVDGWGNVLKREIALNNEKTVLFFDYSKFESNKGKQIRSFTMKIPSGSSDEYSVTELSDIYTFNSSDKRNNGTMQMAYKTGKIEKLVPTFMFSIDYSRSPDVLSDSGLPIGKYEWKTSLYQNGAPQDKNKVDGVFEISPITDKKNAFHYGFNLNVQYEIAPKPASFSFNLDSEDLLPREIIYPDLSKDENINLSTISKTELETFQKDVAKSAIDFVNNNSKILEPILGTSTSNPTTGGKSTNDLNPSKF